MIDWIRDIVQLYLSWPARIQIYFGVAAFLFSCGVLFTIIISISQFYKKTVRSTTAKYRDGVLYELGILVSHASVSDIPEAAHQFKLTKLRELMEKKSTVSDIIMTEMVTLKRNVLGEGADYIIRMYIDLGLKDLSVGKLSSMRWKMVAQGLRELEIMEQYDTQHLFIEFLLHSNSQLRKEARKGLVSIASNPLFFLDNLKDELTDWEAVFILKKLKLRDKSMVPDFSRWYDSPNMSVAVFAVQMTAHFSQFQNIDPLRSLLHSARLVLVLETIQSLRKLEAYTASQDVTKVLNRAKSRRLINASLSFLAHLGDQDSVPIVENYLLHESHLVRFEAVKTLNQLAPGYVFTSPEAISMADHVKSPLLS